MKMWRNRYDVEVVYPIDALKLLLARFLNMLYYRTQVSLFRVLSNKLTFGTVVKVHNIYYVNKLKNVVALNVALGDRNGSTILCQKYATAASSIIERERCRGFVEVPMETLDSIIKKLKISRIDVVKIDVEGAEIKVLRGMVSIIKKFKPYMLVEVRSYNVNEFEKLMGALGLTCEILMKRKNDADYFDYFCYPNERTSMVLRIMS
jgi:FkbM family methyltransferase